MFCTIITGGYGAPHRYYTSDKQALRAAQRHCKRHGEAVEVAWCSGPGNPKLWLAYVTTSGTQLTESWHATQTPA